MPLSNIEQAITNVLATKQVPNYNNVFDAYACVSRLPFDTFGNEGALYFDRAMGKYPAAGEKGGSSFAEYITSIRKQSLQRRIDIIASCMPPCSDRLMCPCLCGEILTMDEIWSELGLDRLVEDLNEIRVPVLPSKRAKLEGTKSRPDKKRKIKKRGREYLFDPSGPSTSAASI